VNSIKQILEELVLVQSIHAPFRYFLLVAGSAKQRRRRLKGQVKYTKQKDGSNQRNGNLQQLRMCGTTAESQGMRLSVTSSYIKHDGCLLFLHSCDTVSVGWMDEAKAKWLQHEIVSDKFMYET
jgi:hypothetical protein